MGARSLFGKYRKHWEVGREWGRDSGKGRQAKKGGLLNLQCTWEIVQNAAWEVSRLKAEGTGVSMPESHW